MTSVPTRLDRAHHVHIAATKFVYYHPVRGIALIDDDPLSVTEAASIDLQPLILYAVSVDSVNIRWLWFSRLRDPKPLSWILTKAWREARGLLGYPDVVMLSHHLSDSAEGLRDKLADTTIRVVVTDSGDRHSSAKLRAAQLEPFKLSFWAYAALHVTSRKLSCLNEVALKYHNDMFWLHDSGGHLSGRNRDEYLTWQEQPPRSFATDLPRWMDWNPQALLAPWLEHSSIHEREREAIFGRFVCRGRPRTSTPQQGRI
ncbi:hypothetical protein [Burkholderia gladioli]|uniref:hypothetical protein n=1 Tax=Burkholderia gladioli TaxID=28095 RepID=UPI00163F8A4B|nr:hypothetical protein [Burkholderia gladioli]